MFAPPCPIIVDMENEKLAFALGYKIAATELLPTLAGVGSASLLHRLLPQLDDTTEWPAFGGTLAGSGMGAHSGSIAEKEILARLAKPLLVEGGAEAAAATPEGLKAIKRLKAFGRIGKALPYLGGIAGGLGTYALLRSLAEKSN